MYIDFSGLITGKDLSAYTYSKDEVYNKVESDARYQIKGTDYVQDVHVDGESVVDEDGIAQISLSGISAGVQDVYVDGESVVDEDGIAQISLSGISAGVQDVKVDGESVVDPVTKEAAISISGKTDGVGISTIRKITVSQYSGLTNPDPETLYVVVADPPVIRALKFSTVNSGETNNLGVFQRGTWTVNLEYSIDEGHTWNEWDYTSSSLTFGNGVDLYVRGMNPNGFGIGNNTRSFQSFGNGLYTVSGNIMWLLDYTQDLQEFQNSGQTFNLMFGNYLNKKLYSVSGLTLPATTLNNDCYYDMFLGCTSLIDTPELPATTLASSCYFRMFDGCTSLTVAPELPATTLVNNCYRWMFANCTSLTEAPVITHDGEEIGGQCCYGMFDGCTSLIQTPEMNIDYSFSSIYEGGGCFREMFKGCTSMTDAVLFDRTDNINYCYAMFSGCTSLTSITCNFSGVNTGGLTNWVAGVASAGTFYRNENLAEEAIGYGNSGIPSGWTVVPPYVHEVNGIKFSTVNTGDTNELSLNNYDYDIEYSLDGGNTWSAFTGSVEFGNGTDLYVRGDNPDGFLDGPLTFALSDAYAPVSVSGNIMHLLSYEEDLLDIPRSDCFEGMFSSMYALQDASGLLLPATGLTSTCYNGTFMDCYNLTGIPSLPSDAVFGNYSCNFMFAGCTAITEAVLDTLTIGSNCYRGMFANCPNLTSITVNATTIDGSAFMEILDGVTQAGTIHCKDGMSGAIEGSGYIPANWTIVEDL